jgi:hypothetical protein
MFHLMHLYRSLCLQHDMHLAMVHASIIFCCFGSYELLFSGDHLIFVVFAEGI